MTITIAGVGIGDFDRCRFVAEISNNHNGDRDRCGRLIDTAKAAGADFVKFQCYTPDELVALRGDGPAPEPWGSQGWSMRDLYTKAQTPLDWFPKIAAHCERVGMPWFSSVFGPESLAVLEANGCPAYKIAALDRRQYSHICDVAARCVTGGKPLVISAPDEPTLEVRSGGPPCQTAWLYAPPGYPQTKFAFAWKFDPDDDCGGPFTGFSFHGTDPLPCVVAATLGAKIIEAHFQLDDEPSELESNVSLRASQFAQMIADVRRVEAMLA